jgi:hypothetical protein
MKMEKMQKKFIMAGVFACCVIVVFSAASGEAKLYLAEPLLIDQPSYAGMRFYVYKPYNMPKGWYATFDGYPVTQNKDGVWVYGTYSGPNLTPTHYIVGSVVPSMAGLSPYIDPVQISSATTLVPPPPIPVGQPSVMRVPLEGAYSTYMPDWLFDDHFMALGRWKSSVDRIGILHRPGVPVAWSGDAPKVIYAWNGHGWHQITARKGQRPVDALKENIYVLTRMVNHNGFVWYEADVPALSQQAATWGYYWMGEIMPQ